MHGLKTLCIFLVAAFVQQCASVDHHVIELLTVVDYSAFKNWFYQTQSNATVNDRVTKTKKNMVEYITSLIKTSNDVFNSLEQHNIYIQIKLIGVMFSMHASTSPWTEKVKVQDKDLYYIDPKKALPIVKSFSRSVQASRPHDHAMVLTRYDLDFGDGNKFSGYAYEAAECTTKSVSVVQDKDGFYTAQLIAHEIGHSLGCKHDGDNNTCPGSDGFAMTPSFIFANKNKWTFSSCSVAYISNFLQSLNKNNCLLVTKRSMSNAHIVSKYYGQQYTVDEQCKIRFGVDSYFCRRPYIIHNNFSEVCLKMECYDRSRDKCYWIDGGDGTPCGNRKWCMLNNCLADSRAPSVRADCPVGDQSGIVMNGMTCRQLLASDSHACFKDDIRYKCCDTCGQQTSTIVSLDQQCVYKHGDGSFLCRGAPKYSGQDVSTILCNEMLCNDPTRENWCLSSQAGDRSTCGNKKWCKNGVCVFDKHAPAVSDDCVFGDQTIGIAAYGLTCEQIKLPENQWRCYDSFTRTKCCQTCQAIKRPNTGCEYGNRSSWCHSNIRTEKDKRICYYGSNADLCCESCTAFADASKANQGCEYGDRLTGCKADICNRYSYDVRRKCCQTCKAGPTKG